MTGKKEPARPIFLFTDFGYEGPYVGQVTATIRQRNRRSEVISLMHDAPRMRPDLAAYLLAAVSAPLPEPSVIVAVVDPGVGGPRRALVVETERLILVGPDNGLLSRVPDIIDVSEIRWPPEGLSPSFHGRDLFAPVAAALALGERVDRVSLGPSAMVGHDWPEALERVIYVDRYGNLMTGVPAEKLSPDSVLRAAGREFGYARTFSRVPEGELFWYRNSQGLAEIAANRTSAAGLLSLALGDRILID